MTELLPVDRMSADELCWRIGDALRRRKLSGWWLNFGKSIARHSTRPGWAPTKRQAACMRALVAELRRGDADFDGEEIVLDTEDDGT
jgi:hypothetical protein